MKENLIHCDSTIFAFYKITLQMDWSELPSLTSLRAFAALAEQKSYTQAATALNVTHAAVSQQVKVLEERLGVSLVTRAGRGVALTTEGALLARDNAVRLQLHAQAYNLGNFTRTLALPREVEHWSMTTLRERFA